MYCVKCGVELNNGEVKCPLCNTPTYNPDINVKKDKFYPDYIEPKRKYNRQWVMLTVTVLYLIAGLICLFINLRINKKSTWSLYVLVGMAVVYVGALLPQWFNKRKYVIYVPATGCASILYLLLICKLTNGSWFIKLGLPVGIWASVLATSLVALITYLKKGHLYVYGGSIIATGLLCFLIEFLIYKTFNVEFLFWSFYPLIACGMIGLFIIFVAICRPFRDFLEKKLFL